MYYTQQQKLWDEERRKDGMLCHQKKKDQEKHKHKDTHLGPVYTFRIVGKTWATNL